MNQRYRSRSPNPCTEWLAISLIGLSLAGPACAENLPASGIDPSASGSAVIGAEGADDLSVLLPILVTSAEQKRLAADLRDAIEHGNLKQAESNLTAAIETGTLAIALVNSLRDPNLLSTLRGLDLQIVRLPGDAPVEGNVSAQAAAANLAQLQEALDHEQSYSGMVTRTLSDLMERYNVLASGADTESPAVLKVSELQNDLQHEQRQRETIAQELASLQADYRTLQAAKEASSSSMSREVSDLEARLQQEHQRSEEAGRQLASAREEARSLLAFKDGEIKDREAKSAARIAELEDVLSQTRARADEFARRLSDATEALHAIQEANERKPAALVLQSAPVEPRTNTVILQVAASEPAPPAPLPKQVGAAPRNGAPSAQEGALIEVARLPESIRPLSASATPDVASVLTGTKPVPEVKASAPPQTVAPDDRLANRADELFRKGDVSGARLLLERSLKNGNARAAFLLAETFDPRVLSELGVRGLRGDPGKAREFYTRAQALGMPQAAERLETLK